MESDQQKYRETIKGYMDETVHYTMTLLFMRIMTDMERIIGTPQWCNQNDRVTRTPYGCAPPLRLCSRQKSVQKCGKYFRVYMIFNNQEQLSCYMYISNYYHWLC